MYSDCPHFPDRGQWHGGVSISDAGIHVPVMFWDIAPVRVLTWCLAWCSFVAHVFLQRDIKCHKFRKENKSSTDDAFDVFFWTTGFTLIFFTSQVTHQTFTSFLFKNRAWKTTNNDTNFSLHFKLFFPSFLGTFHCCLLDFTVDPLTVWGLMSSNMGKHLFLETPQSFSLLQLGPVIFKYGAFLNLYINTSRRAWPGECTCPNSAA